MPPYSSPRKRNPKSPSKRPLSWPELWFKDKALKHVVFKMQLESIARRAEKKPSPASTPHAAEVSGVFNHNHRDHHLDDYDDDEGDEDADADAGCSPSGKTDTETGGGGGGGGGDDLTCLLSDELLLQIFSKLPESFKSTSSNSLVCKRWMILLGRQVRSVKVLEWNFLESGRLVYRFPNLTDVDIACACVDSSLLQSSDSGILLSNRFISIHLDSSEELFSSASQHRFISEDNFLPLETIDRGLRIISQGCPNLRKLVLISASEVGLSSVAQECPTLQELELHACTDLSLRGISACQNLQILKLIGCVDGFYNSVISDIGFTILAHGCKRLVKLELSGCEGSYDGIRAIGQCCHMLEELTLSDHRMDAGWLAALSFCGNLKTLKLMSCKKIDPDPGPVEHLGSCPTLERLHLQRCQLRDKQSVTSLFLVCSAIRDVVIQDCWGLDNDMFSIATICRRVKLLYLEGCSLLTTDGLESVILSWVELQRLRVISCKSIKDSEVTPALSSVFSALKELKWRPDTRSLLSSSLADAGIGKKGGKFFKRRNTIKGNQSS